MLDRLCFHCSQQGFKGIWGSGLSVSAQLGVRDSNEASWTQVMEVLEFMSDASDVPILLDADTGYGNFNNARRLVNKLEKIGVAGACLEDKLFPKTNSLLDGRAQPLADVEEFSLKIKACKGDRISIQHGHVCLNFGSPSSPVGQLSHRPPILCNIMSVSLPFVWLNVIQPFKTSAHFSICVSAVLSFLSHISALL